MVQFHSLLENAAFLVELDALCPIIESACDVDFFGRMLPSSSQDVSNGDG